MASQPHEPLRFFAELRRRKVFRAVFAYVAIAFIALQIIDLLIPATNLPSWADALLLAIAIMGFPVCIIAAWALEQTPDGVRFTQPVGNDNSEHEPRQPMTVGLAATLGLFVAAGAVWWFLVSPSQDELAAVENTIAVMPFETLGADKANAFTEGVHLGVLTRLSNVSELEVISRTSVRAIDTKDKTLPEIAEALGASWILRAEVQVSGTNVQINARLIDARQDRQVWAQNYQRELTVDNIFDIQSELALAIIEALHKNLTPLERARVDQRPTDNLEAYGLFTSGRSELDRRDEQGMRAAVVYFEQAIALDANYALAWTGLADALILLYDYHIDRDDSHLIRAEEAIHRALELDPFSAEAFASLGLLNHARQNSPEAIQALTRAVKLKPNYADAQSWLAWGYQISGNPEAGLTSAKKAVLVNPLSGESRSNLTLSYLATGDYDQALVEALHNQDLLASWPTALFYEGIALYHQGHFAEAQTTLKDLSVDWTDFGAESLLALSYIATGDEQAAREILDALILTDDFFSVALVYAALGESDLAFTTLQRIDHWNSWPALALRHFFPSVIGPLREDARYQAIIDNLDKSWGIDDRTPWQ